MQNLSRLLLIPIITRGINFLFWDDFCEDDDSPLTDPLIANPGPGEWDVTENDGSFAKSSGRLEYTAQTTPILNDLKLAKSTPLNRDGIALVYAITDMLSDFATDGEWYGLSGDTLIGVADFSILEANSGVSIQLYPLGVLLSDPSADNDTYFICAVGDDGFVYRLRGDECELLFVQDISSIASGVYPIFENRNSTGSIDSLRGAQLNPALFTPAIDIASPVTGDGSVSGGDPALPDGDVFVEVKAPVSDVWQFDFRVQGSNDYWRFEISVTGATTRIIEVVAGVATDRILVAGAIAGIEIFRMRANGNIIDVSKDGSLIGSYSSANTSLRDTGWDLTDAGTGSANLRIWKHFARNESGLGNEIVTNGGFDTDTGWAKGTGWTIASGVASCDGTQVSSTNLFQNAVSMDGLYISVTFTISNFVAGDVRAIVGVVGGTFRTANGTYTEILAGGSVNDDDVIIQGNLNFIGDIDNVSIQEVLFTPDNLRINLDRVIAPYTCPPPPSDFTNEFTNEFA